MKMMRSVRLRLTLLYIGSISLLVFIFGVIIFLSLQAVLLRDIDNDLHNGGKRLEVLLSKYALQREHDPGSLSMPSPQGDVWLVDTIDEATTEIFVIHLAYVQLIAFPEDLDTVIHVIAKTDTLKEHTLPLSETAYQAVQTNVHVVEIVTGVFPFPLRVMTLAVYDKDRRPYILQIGLSLHDIQTEIYDLLIIFAVSFPVLFVVVSVLGYVFMKGAFSPVKRMVAVARRITAEDLSLRIDPLHSHDEIGELATTLNEMISRLERSFNHSQQFSADVSHELKTPLAKLKCHAEVTLRRDRTRKEYQHVLMKMIEDTEKLQKIIEDLFFLVSMDTRNVPLSFRSLPLHDVFFMVFEELQPLATKRAVGVVFEDIEAVTLKGDLGLLKRLFTNLLLNAIQYTPSGGDITVSLRKDADYAILILTDTGIGIPKEALPYIFDRFYRVDPSRSYETGGSGLGLAIAQKSVEFHDGTISVRSDVGHGTTFRVSLPCFS